MAELPQFSNYNEATARSLIESNNRNMGGLPAFIGMERSALHRKLKSLGIG